MGSGRKPEKARRAPVTTTALPSPPSGRICGDGVRAYSMLPSGGGGGREKRGRAPALTLDSKLDTRTHTSARMERNQHVAEGGQTHPRDHTLSLPDTPARPERKQKVAEVRGLWHLAHKGGQLGQDVWPVVIHDEVQVDLGRCRGRCG